MHLDIEESSTEHNSSSSGSTVSTLQLHTPGFGVRASGRRSIVLPKPEPIINFPPAPPPHEYYHHQLPLQQSSALDDNNESYCSLTECFECLNDNVPVYATTNLTTISRRGGCPSQPTRYPPNNFGLSKRGLLQIDYSFNWNNLYRFITK